MSDGGMSRPVEGRPSTTKSGSFPSERAFAPRMRMRSASGVLSADTRPRGALPGASAAGGAASMTSSSSADAMSGDSSASCRGTPAAVPDHAWPAPQLEAAAAESALGARDVILDTVTTSSSSAEGGSAKSTMVTRRRCTFTSCVWTMYPTRRALTGRWPLATPAMRNQPLLSVSVPRVVPTIMTCAFGTGLPVAKSMACPSIQPQHSTPVPRCVAAGVAPTGAVSAGPGGRQAANAPAARTASAQSRRGMRSRRSG